MEFHEKLQELRKKNGLTQEELAGALFVSRTAVSKWESGRGYPNIDSLKAIGKFFGITIDELLSGDELLTIAEADSQQKENHFRDLMFGLLDCSSAMFFFLPFFGQRGNEIVEGVPLPSLTEIAPYLRIAYLLTVFGSVLAGILTLALQNCEKPFWVKNKSKLSLIVTAVGTFVFMLSLQSYAAAFLFILLLIKALILIKWP